MPTTTRRVSASSGDPSRAAEVRAVFTRIELMAALVFLTGCGGGAPLLHPAHTLRPGYVSMGAGLSARLAVIDPGSSVDTAVPLDDGDAVDAALEDVAVEPGLAPWVSARVGIEGDNEAGLTYTARAVRLDGRHAFQFGPLFLSTGIGGSAIVPRPRGEDGEDLGSVTGGGLDLPILLGVVSSSDIYALWIGPRAGFELLTGNLAIEQGSVAAASEAELAALDAQHFYVGGLAGLRAGFRHVHAALEVAAQYHHASGDLGAASVTIEQLAITPGAAIVVSF